MKNHWLDKNKPPTILELETHIRGMKSENFLERDLHKCWFKECILKIIKKVIYLRGKYFHGREDVVQDCLSLCLKKVHKFNLGKGNAWNYFSTIILGHLYQLKRSEENEKQMDTRRFSGRKTREDIWKDSRTDRYRQNI